MNLEKKKELLAVIDDLVRGCQSENYNLADLMISPLYLETIAADIPVNWLARIVKNLRQTAFSLREGLRKLPNSYTPAVHRRSVMLCPATVSHIRQLYPVSLELKIMQVNYVWVVNKVSLFALLKEKNERSLLLKTGIKNYSSFKSDRDRFFDILKSIRGKDKIKSVLENVFEKRVSQTASLIGSFENLVSSWHPSALIVGNDLTVEGRVATAVFKKHQIYTACIQHGEMSGVLDSRHRVDEFFVYGNSSKASLEQSNENVNFIVSGAPYLDSGVEADKQLVRISEKLNVTEKYVLVAFSGAGNNTSLDQHKMFIDSVAKMAQRLPGTTFVIKLHPKDKIEYYLQKNLDRIRNVRIVDSKSDSLPREIFPWLKGSKVLLTGASMTAIEAMELGVPVISMDYLNEYSSIDFIKNQIPVKVKNEAELELNLKRVISNGADPSASERAGIYASHYFASHPGLSASAFIANRVLTKQV